MLELDGTENKCKDLEIHLIKVVEFKICFFYVKTWKGGDVKWQILLKPVQELGKQNI